MLVHKKLRNVLSTLFHLRRRVENEQTSRANCETSALATHAASTFPEGACGVLLGRQMNLAKHPLAASPANNSTKTGNYNNRIIPAETDKRHQQRRQLYYTLSDT